MAPVAAPDAALAPSPETAPATDTALDAHGHDPDAYRWVPVLKKRRKDGWSPDRQRKWKVELIAASNPDWRDLAEELGLPPLDG